MKDGYTILQKAAKEAFKAYASETYQKFPQQLTYEEKQYIFNCLEVFFEDAVTDLESEIYTEEEIQKEIDCDDDSDNGGKVIAVDISDGFLDDEDN